MTELQQQARALGDPTRHAIFQYVVGEGRPVDVAELTEHFGLNHNAIRQHLAKLVDAELLTEGRATDGARGRPKLLYRPHPAADSRWGATGPYERLSVLLAEMIRTGDSAYDVGKRSVGRPLEGPDPHDAPLEFVFDAIERQGFEPEIRNARRDRVELVLRTCPFESGVLADPETVCELHRGIAEGITAFTDDRLVVAELVARDPRRAQCRLRLHRTATQESGSPR